MKPVKKEFNKNLILQFKSDQSTKFSKYFYDITFNKGDRIKYKNYAKVILNKNKGLTPIQISRSFKIPRKDVKNWYYKNSKLFTIRLLEHYLILGKTKNNMKWASLNSTRGGSFTGPWIEVPTKIQKYNDLNKIIKQLEVLPEFKEKNKFFKISLNSYKKEKLFAYALGFFIGDASKTGINRKQRTARRVCIRLSKRYPTNERMGEFVSLCFNSIGIRMGRRKDCPAGKRNPYPFYTWISQSSALIQWINEVCLGLNNNDRTTYNPVKAKWILKTPNYFKISFLQGLADSDGFVDFSAKQVGILTGPNTKLAKDILNSLNVKTTPRFFKSSKLWSLMMSLNDAYKLPVFNPIIKSYRYQDMEKLFKAKRFHRHPSWLKEKIDQNIKKGICGTALVKKILYEDKIAISIDSIQRRTKKLKEQKI